MGNMVWKTTFAKEGDKMTKIINSIHDFPQAVTDMVGQWYGKGEDNEIPHEILYRHEEVNTYDASAIVVVAMAEGFRKQLAFLRFFTSMTNDESKDSFRVEVSVDKEIPYEKLLGFKDKK